MDNRRANLRVCEQTQNSLNHAGHRIRSSRFKGVTAHQGAWMARFREKYLGVYKREEDAALAYDQAAKSADPEFAWVNFPSEK
ncbi:MAG: hypothetical protein M9944_13030 [Rhizobiaceae bacterium]|nr:hypothetical protein [Rhizobiaceae bacterium]